MDSNSPSDPEQRQCPRCRKPIKSSSGGMITQLLEICQCSLQESKEDTEQALVERCPACKLPIPRKRKGTITQFIFGAKQCSCQRAALSENGFESANSNKQQVKRQVELETDVESTEQLEDLEDIVIAPESFPFERYEPLKLLGSGASGRVYLCKDRLLRKRVAVKSLHILDGKQLIAFQEEAKATCKLNHPNIIQVLDFGASASGAPYMVMEFFDGLSIEQALHEFEKLNIDLAIDIAIEICHALTYAHFRKILHRDIKPSNILVSESTSGGLDVRLIDFGVAKVKEATLSGKELQKQTVAGTPAYLAPDTILGYPYSVRSEIYSLACVMFEMITGRPPFIGETAIEVVALHAQSPVPSLRDFGVEQSPKELELLLENCLAKDPNIRPQSMEALKEQLIVIKNSYYFESVNPTYVQSKGETIKEAKVHGNQTSIFSMSRKANEELTATESKKSDSLAQTFDKKSADPVPEADGSFLSSISSENSEKSQLSEISELSQNSEKSDRSKKSEAFEGSVGFDGTDRAIESPCAKSTEVTDNFEDINAAEDINSVEDIDNTKHVDSFRDVNTAENSDDTESITGAEDIDSSQVTKKSEFRSSKISIHREKYGDRIEDTDRDSNRDTYRDKDRNKDRDRKISNSSTNADKSKCTESDRSENNYKFENSKASKFPRMSGQVNSSSRAKFVDPARVETIENIPPSKRVSPRSILTILAIVSTAVLIGATAINHVSDLKLNPTENMTVKFNQSPIWTMDEFSNSNTKVTISGTKAPVNDYLQTNKAPRSENSNPLIMSINERQETNKYVETAIDDFMKPQSIDVSKAIPSDPEIKKIQETNPTKMYFHDLTLNEKFMNDIARCNRLHTLYLEKITIPSASCLKPLSKFPKLESIVFVNTVLSPEIIEPLTRMKRLGAVSFKDYNFIPPSVIGEICKSPVMWSIRFTNCTLSTNNLKEIAENKILRSLTMFNCKGINPSGLAPIAELPTLLEVDLSDSQITDFHLAVLGRSMNLKYLALSGNALITERGLHRIGNKSHKVSILISRDMVENITPAGIRRLQSEHAIIVNPAKEPQVVDHR